MIKDAIEKLEEADELLKEKIIAACKGMRNLEESRCSKARMLIQVAITELLRCG